MDHFQKNIVIVVLIFCVVASFSWARLERSAREALEVKAKSSSAPPESAESVSAELARCDERLRELRGEPPKDAEAAEDAAPPPHPVP